MAASPAQPMFSLASDHDEQGTSLVERDTLQKAPTASRQRAARRELVIRVELPAPNWLEAVVSDLDRILALEDGWDSYGAIRVKHGPAIGLVKLLATLGRDVRSPGIFPVPSGAILIEWNSPAGDLEIELEGEDHLSLVAQDSASGAEWESEGISQMRFLTDYLPKVSHLIPRG